MILKPADPAAVIRDPVTKMRLPAEGGPVPDTNYWVRRTLAGTTYDAEVWVREGDEWTRNMRNGSVMRESATPAAAPTEPTGLEPTPPLQTRARR